MKGSYPDTTIRILAREKRRASFIFGFRWAKIWEWVENHGPETPESLAHVIWANFEEALLELPEDYKEVYKADGIYWIN